MNVQLCASGMVGAMAAAVLYGCGSAAANAPKGLPPAPLGNAELVNEAAPEGSMANTPATRAAERARRHAPDLSGSPRLGKASFYAEEFFGRTMANGAPMDPEGDNAASKTLPLGTTARVINLETGRSAVVKIADRGPYVPGRIVDLSPATARKIGLSRRQGVAKVIVAPIKVPLPGGAVRLGNAEDQRLMAAMLDTRSLQQP